MKTILRFVPVFIFAIILSGVIYAEEAAQEDLGPTPEKKAPPAQDSLLPPSIEDIEAAEGKTAAPAKKEEPAKPAVEEKPAKPAAEAKPPVAPVAAKEEPAKTAAPVTAPRPGVPRVAVLPFVNSTKEAGPAEKVAGIAAPTLQDLLVNTGKVDVVERSRIDEMLTEINFGASGLVDAPTAAKMGKLLGVTHIVTGDVQRVARDRQITKAYNIESTKETYYVVLLVRVIDAVNGKVVTSKKAEKSREQVLTKYNEKQETDIVTPLMEEALKGVVGDLVTAMSPGEKKEGKTFAVKFDSQPTGADVEVDGIFEGNCPVDADLETGVHVVKITLPGYEVWEQKIKVRDGKNKPIMAKLVLKPVTTNTNVDVNINKK